MEHTPEPEPVEPDPPEGPFAKVFGPVQPVTCSDFPLCGHSMWTCFSPVNRPTPYSVPRHIGRQYS